MRKLLIIFLIISINSIAQVHLDYPKGQESYEGGFPQLYKELREIISKKNVNCGEKEAIYIKIMVEPDASIKYVAEPDTLAISQNKCSFELLKQSLKELKHWKPAEYNGVKEKSITRFLFSPIDLLKNGNAPKKDDGREAEFPGGLGKFREKFINCVDLRRFSADGKLQFKLDFEVNTQGKIQNIFVDTQIDNKEFLDMIVGCLETKKKTTWTPANYKGTPIITRFKMPITINFQ